MQEAVEEVEATMQKTPKGDCGASFNSLSLP